MAKTPARRGGRARARIDWPRVRLEYETTGKSFRQLGKKYGVAASTVARRSQREGWGSPGVLAARRAERVSKTIERRFIEREGETILEDLADQHRVNLKLRRLADRRVDWLGQVQDELEAAWAFLLAGGAAGCEAADPEAAAALQAREERSLALLRMRDTLPDIDLAAQRIARVNIGTGQRGDTLGDLKADRGFRSAGSAGEAGSGALPLEVQAALDELDGD